MSSKDVTIDDVFFAAQRVWGFSKKQICEKHKVGAKSFARHAIRWYLMKEMNFISQETASVTGRINHATMLHSIKVVNDLVETKQKPFVHEFQTFLTILGSVEYKDLEVGGAIEQDGTIKLQRNDSMVMLKDNQITIVTNKKITKHPFDQEKSVNEFISVVLSITK